MIPISTFFCLLVLSVWAEYETHKFLGKRSRVTYETRELCPMNRLASGVTGGQDIFLKSFRANWFPSFLMIQLNINSVKSCDFLINIEVLLMLENFPSRRTFYVFITTFLLLASASFAYFTSLQCWWKNIFRHPMIEVNDLCSPYVVRATAIQLNDTVQQEKVKIIYVTSERGLNVVTWKQDVDAAAETWSISDGTTNGSALHVLWREASRVLSSRAV